MKSYEVATVTNPRDVQPVAVKKSLVGIFAILSVRPLAYFFSPLCCFVHFHYFVQSMAWLILKRLEHFFSTSPFYKENVVLILLYTKESVLRRIYQLLKGAVSDPSSFLTSLSFDSVQGSPRSSFKKDRFMQEIQKSLVCCWELHKAIDIKTVVALPKWGPAEFCHKR